MKPARILSHSITSLLAVSVFTSAALAQIPITGSGTYLQDFNSLPTAAASTWFNNNTIPGWYARTNTLLDSIPLGLFNAGAAPARGFYNMGVANDSDRTLGFCATTTNYAMTLMGVVFTNTTATPILFSNFNYRGEMWRTPDVANNVDGFQFFYQIAAVPVTDLGPFTVNNGNTYANNAAVADPGWTRVAELDYFDSNPTANLSPTTPFVKNIAHNLGLALQPGQSITFRWRDANDTAGDAWLGLDDLSISYSVLRNLTYNLAHTVGGAPNGVLEVSAAAYWLDGASPVGFANGDTLFLSQDGTASINVPANVTPSTLTVSAASGTYTVGGAGTIGGALVKSNAGTLSLTSANVFSGVTLSGGGTIITANAAALGNGNLTVDAGGGTLQTTSDLTIAGGVLGTGDLTKSGTGTLTLAGASSHSGAFAINAGTLRLTGSLPNNHQVIVGNGGIFKVNGIVGAGSVTLVGNGGRLSGIGNVGGATTFLAGGTLETGENGTGTLTLENLTFAGAGTIAFNVGSTGSVTGFNGLTAAGAAGSVLINVSGATVQGNTYTVLNYEGTIGGTGAAAFALGTLPNRVLATLADSLANTALELTITGVDFPLWSGALNSEWSTAVLGAPKNWVLNSNNATTTDFVATDTVRFTDLATNTTVNIGPADVLPSQVTFDNTTKDYILNGTSGITGVTTLVKNGAAVVTINNANSFTGAVTLNAGTVRVGTVANSGVNSPLGAGSTINFNGGTLEFTGATGTTNRPLAFTADGTVRTNTALTLSGALSGAGTFIKAGTGTVIIAGTVDTAVTTVGEGTLQVGDGATAGVINGTVTNNAALVFDHADTATTTATLAGTGTVEKRGAGTLVLGGFLPNTSTGTTTVTTGTVVAGKGAGTNAIGGDLILAIGTAFSYGTGFASNQVADGSSITVNGGTFGDYPAAGVNPTDPGAGGAFETVANVTVNSGLFSSGRTNTAGVFTITGALNVVGGEAITHRAANVTANSVSVTGPGILTIDGAATGAASRLNVGAGGLTLNNGTINFNIGRSAAFAAGSLGSIVTLNGNVTSAGTSSLVRFNPTQAAPAQLDFGFGDRTFDVTGTLNVGSTVAPITIQNGGLIKTGAGTMNIPGAQLYAGPTTINGGALGFEGSLASSLVTVGTGGTLTGAGVINALTLGAGPGDLATLNVVRGSALTALTVLNNDALIANGAANSVTINVSGFAPGVGSVVLIDYLGNLGGANGFAAFKLGTLPNRVQGNLVNDLVNGSINLDVTGVDQPLWSGALSSDWSLAVLGAPKNWVLNSNNATTTDFLALDNVLFTDFANNTTVALDVEDVTPTVVTFNNAAKNYTLNGTRAIIGSATLIKDGAGTLTINNTNSFTGGVTLTNGTLRVATLANSGINGPLGAGSTINFNGGTLEFTAATGTTNRVLDLGTVGGAIRHGAVAADQLTLTGAINGALGGGTLTKVGAGTLVIGGAGAGFNSTLAIKEGVVQATVAAVGGNNLTMLLDGGTYSNTDTAEVAFSDGAAVLRALSTTAVGGTIHVLNAAGAIQYQTPNGITGSGPITKTGPGIIRARVSNATLASNWILNEGTLEASVVDALGTGTITVNNGLLTGRNTPVGNPVVMNGGTLGTRSGDLTDYLGTVTVNAPATVSLISYTTPGNSQIINISGLLSGTGNLTLTGNNPQTNGGNKGLILHNPLNTYSGTFLVTAGQGLASIPATTGNTLGTATISLTDAGLVLRDDGTGNDGLLTYGNNVIIAGTATSLIDVNSVLAVGNTGNTIQLGNLNIGGQTLLVLGGNGYKAAFGGATTLTGTPTFNTTTADLILKGGISGNFGVIKQGPGQLDLDGAGTFTGPVDVQGGTLAVDGSITSDVTVGPAILAGSGTISGNATTTSAGSGISPGSPVGILRVGLNVQAFAGTTFTFDLAHGAGPQPVPGTDYDQLVVGTGVGAVSTGTVNITDANLVLNLGAGLLQNDLFFLILNDGTDTINGTFIGLPDNQIFQVAGQDIRISYDANATAGTINGGNDVAVEYIPEPGSAALLLGGLGLLAASRRRKK